MFEVITAVHCVGGLGDFFDVLRCVVFVFVFIVFRVIYQESLSRVGNNSLGNDEYIFLLQEQLLKCTQLLKKSGVAHVYD